MLTQPAPAPALGWERNHKHKEDKNVDKTESKITYRVGLGKDSSIPGRARVRFEIGDNAIDFLLRDGKVKVRVAWGSLVIIPEASNAVSLLVQEMEQ